MGGGSRSAPGSLDSIGWNPDKQIIFVTMVTFSIVMVYTQNIVLSLLAVATVCLPVPYIIVSFPWLQRKLLFHSWYYKPEHDLKHPELFDLPQARNIYIGPHQMGCWYLEGKNDKVVIYCHGSSGSRGNGYRIQLVKYLSTLGCTVYSFDYRGYGDSPGVSNQENLIEDTLNVINIARNEHPAKKIILYGHSLGTGIASQAAFQLQGENIIRGIILEAPFLSIPEVILEYPAVKLLNSLPIYKDFVWKFSDTFITRDVIENLSNVLILFAKDDEVISTDHPRKLHLLCKNSQLHLINEGGHNFLILQESVRQKIQTHLASI